MGRQAANKLAAPLSGLSCATCRVCPSGYGDCNKNKLHDGCETHLNSLTNCATCGEACSRPNAVATCSTGACDYTTCNAGRLCGGEAGATLGRGMRPMVVALITRHWQAACNAAPTAACFALGNLVQGTMIAMVTAAAVARPAS